MQLCGGWVLIGLLLALCCQLSEEISVAELCQNTSSQSSNKLAIFCDTIHSYLRKGSQDAILIMPVTGEQRNLLSDLDDDDVYFGIRNRRSGDAADRVRRGGNYIRFGRSVAERSNSHLQNYLKSFGGPQKKAGHYVRFGRSTDEAEKEMAAQVAGDKRFMRFGKRQDDDEDEEEKRFMRFGRGFMRFGRGFMRFGRNNVAEDSAKRYMRFGKKSDYSEGTPEKKFMRFGKKFMRFGKRDDDESEDDKRSGVVAFNPYDQIKRKYMRFGKRADEVQLGKKFMRFGRDPELQDGELPEQEKRFMRFGKKSADSEDPDEVTSEDAQYIRNLEEAADDDVQLPDKKYMRFGKKDSPSDSEDLNDKRFMRFGRSV